MYHNNKSTLSYRLTHVQYHAKVKLEELKKLSQEHIFRIVEKRFVDEYFNSRKSLFSRTFSYEVSCCDFTYNMWSFDSLPQKYQDLLKKGKSLKCIFAISRLNNDLSKYFRDINDLQDIVDLKNQHDDQWITIPIHIAKLIF